MSNEESSPSTNNWQHWLPVHVTIAMIFLMAILDYGSQLLYGLLLVSSINRWAATLISLTVTGALVVTFSVWGYRWYKRNVGFPKLTRRKIGTNLLDDLSNIPITILISSTLTYTIYHYSQHVPTVSTNQKTLDTLFQASSATLCWAIVLSVIIGPLIEEMIFRVLLIGPKATKTIVPTRKHRAAMAIISFVLFTVVHVADQWMSLKWQDPTAVSSAITATVQYGTLAGMLTLNYWSHGDWRRTLMLHVIWNIIALYGALS